MTLCAALPPIRDCTDPFRPGADLDVVLWLSAIHVYGSGGRRPEIHAFADPMLGPLIHQPGGNAAHPDLTFLRSTIEASSLSNARTAKEPPSTRRRRRFGSSNRSP